MSKPSEKRSFFRINSDIVMDYRSIDSYTLEHTSVESQFPDNLQSLTLFQELKRLDKEAAPYLGAISELSRPLSDYLSILSKKVDLVAQQHLAEHSSHEHLVATQVNLSEGGLAFTTEKPLYKGSHLAIQLRFLSDFSSIACFATVIRCDLAKKNSSDKSTETYHIACKFHQLSEAKQEVIGKQIMQAQLAARRTT
ncbi:MAG: PilZ domain-containing protein [Cellvibrionaceae bacterium]